MQRHARFATFVAAPIALFACHLTTAERGLLVALERDACTLVPLVVDIPEGIEAKACAAAEGATAALPASEAAVRLAVKAAAAQPPVTESVQHVADASAYHGRIVDRRARMAFADGGADAAH